MSRYVLTSEAKADLRDIEITSYVKQAFEPHAMCSAPLWQLFAQSPELLAWDIGAKISASVKSCDSGLSSPTSLCTVLIGNH